MVQTVVMALIGLVGNTQETIDRLKFCHPNRKEIIQFDLNNRIINIFNSIRECEYITKLSRTHIIKCCKNGRNKTVNGFYFRYIDNYFPCIKSNIEPDMNYIDSKIKEFNLTKPAYITKREELNSKIKEGNKLKRISIIHYDLEGKILGEYQSMSEARDNTKCHIGLISKCCNLKSHYTVNNTTFRYKGDTFDYKPYNVSIQANSRKLCKYNLDGTLVTIFDSIKQGARSVNTSDGNITKCCNQKINKKTGKFLSIKGFTWRYFEETNGKNIN